MPCVGPRSRCCRGGDLFALILTLLPGLSFAAALGRNDNRALLTDYLGHFRYALPQEEPVTPYAATLGSSDLLDTTTSPAVWRFSTSSGPAASNLVRSPEEMRDPNYDEAEEEENRLLYEERLRAERAAGYDPGHLDPDSGSFFDNEGENFLEWLASQPAEEWGEEPRPQQAPSDDEEREIHLAQVAKMSRADASWLSRGPQEEEEEAGRSLGRVDSEAAEMFGGGMAQLGGGRQLGRDYWEDDPEDEAAAGLPGSEADFGGEDASFEVGDEDGLDQDDGTTPGRRWYRGRGYGADVLSSQLQREARRADRTDRRRGTLSLGEPNWTAALETVTNLTECLAALPHPYTLSAILSDLGKDHIVNISVLGRHILENTIEPALDGNGSKSYAEDKAAGTSHGGIASIEQLLEDQEEFKLDDLSSGSWAELIVEQVKDNVIGLDTVVGMEVLPCLKWNVIEPVFQQSKQWITQNVRLAGKLLKTMFDLTFKKAMQWLSNRVLDYMQQHPQSLAVVKYVKEEVARECISSLDLQAELTWKYVHDLKKGAKPPQSDYEAIAAQLRTPLESSAVLAQTVLASWLGEFYNLIESGIVDVILRKVLDIAIINSGWGDDTVDAICGLGPVVGGAACIINQLGRHVAKVFVSHRLLAKGQELTRAYFKSIGTQGHYFVSWAEAVISGSNVTLKAAAAKEAVSANDMDFLSPVLDAVVDVVRTFLPDLEAKLDKCGTIRAALNQSVLVAGKSAGVITVAG